MRLTLEPDMTVVGEASNGREAVTLVQQLAPDIVLMDVEMPVMDGIEAAVVMYASTPQSAVVMLSIHDDVYMLARTHAAGATAFVNKRGAIVDIWREGMSSLRFSQGRRLRASFRSVHPASEIQSSRSEPALERSEGMTCLTPLKPAHEKPYLQMSRAIEVLVAMIRQAAEQRKTETGPL